MATVVFMWRGLIDYQLGLLLGVAMAGCLVALLAGTAWAFHLGLPVAFLGVWFFLWLGLLSKYELSQLYAFEGLSPVFLMASAWLFLGEKVPLRGWIGVSLIGAGLMLVAGV